MEPETETITTTNGEASTPIECRAAVDLSPTVNNEILFLPVGLHAITPVSGGIGRPIKVKIDEAAAVRIENQRGALMARGKRPYFDFNHEDGPASFWPDGFAWRHGEGVVARGEWTRRGRDAVEGKDFRAFSPVFHVDNKRADAAVVVCKEDAEPNMGGLVNNPAFKNLPLWAKNAESLGNPPEQPAKTQPKNGETDMTNEDKIAELRAKNEELAKEKERLEGIVAKNGGTAPDDLTASKLEAAEAEIRATEMELKAAQLQAKSDAQDEIIKKRAKADAQVAVKQAVLRGAVLAKDIRTQESLVARATADPSFISVIDAMQGPGAALRDRITSASGRVTVKDEDPIRVFGELAKLTSVQARASSNTDKSACAREFAAVYAKELRGATGSRLLNSPMSILADAIAAADVTDTNLGTLAGTLVTQRTLELLKVVFPSLVRFTTDFSAEPATFNQTLITRIITIPTVQTYSTTSGWTDATAATTDVPVTLNNHKGVPITFNENILASTMRRLFDEFAPASAYALAKNIVDALYANLTDANFTNNTVSASTAFNRATVIDIGTALTTRGVPLGLDNRTLLLWPAAFGNLEKDTALQTFAGFQAPRIVTEGTTEESAFAVQIEAFKIYSAPNMPSNNANLVGFGGSKSALVIVTRTPNDYTTVLPGASFGSVQMVTDPDIGITVMQTQYVNHTLGTATSRIAIMYGTAPGQTAAGQLVKANTGSGSSR